MWYAVRAAVTLIRIGWLVYLWTILLTVAIGLGVLVFIEGWWWLGLTVAAFGYATFVLHRSRRRRAEGEAGNVNSGPTARP